MGSVDRNVRTNDVEGDSGIHSRSISGEPSVSNSSTTWLPRPQHTRIVSNGFKNGIRSNAPSSLKPHAQNASTSNSMETDSVIASAKNSTDTVRQRNTTGNISLPSAGEHEEGLGKPGTQKSSFNGKAQTGKRANNFSGAGGDKEDLQTHCETFESRLHSYLSCDIKLPASACAQAGFIYNAEKNILQCVWCEIELDIDGVEGVDIHAYHAAASSSCPFVLSSLEKENQLMEVDEENSSSDEINLLTYQRQRQNSAAIDADSEEAASSALQKRYQRISKPRSEQTVKRVGKSKISSQSQNSMKVQRNRILSFKTKQFHDTPITWYLAADGFYLSGGTAHDQHITCVFCDTTILFSKEDATSIEYRKQVEVTHRERACPFILGAKSVGNRPDLFDETTWLTNSSKSNKEANVVLVAAEDVGINYSQAAHPEMAVLERRQLTFLTIPYGFNKHSEELYECGLFFAGNSEVICFSCGSKFTDFDETQSVWIRHIRTAPQCTFVKHQKGQDYINSILEQFGPYTPPPPESKINTITTRMLRPRMDAIVTCKALNMGLSREEVRNVISSRIKQGKPDFKTIAEIFIAVHETRREERKADETFQPLPVIKKPPIVQLPVTMETENEPEVAELEDTVLEAELDEIEMNTPKGDPLIQGNSKELALQVKSQLTCKICLSDIVGIIFLPCGHLTCCVNCSAAMVSCPLCRNSVNGTVKANFLSYELLPSQSSEKNQKAPEKDPTLNSMIGLMGT